MDTELAVSVLADAIDAMEKDLVAVGSKQTLRALREIRPIALAAPDMRDACARAIPWLVLLGDHIGNGTEEEPNGRCDTILALKRAITKAEGRP